MPALKDGTTAEQERERSREDGHGYEVARRESEGGRERELLEDASDSLHANPALTSRVARGRRRRNADGCWRSAPL